MDTEEELRVTTNGHEFTRIFDGVLTDYANLGGNLENMIVSRICEWS